MKGIMKIKRVYAIFFSPTNGIENYVRTIAEKLSSEYQVINLTKLEERNKEYFFNRMT